jgi:hypothetical protein
MLPAIRQISLGELGSAVDVRASPRLEALRLHHFSHRATKVAQVS